MITKVVLFLTLAYKNGMGLIITEDSHYHSNVSDTIIKTGEWAHLTCKFKNETNITTLYWKIQECQTDSPILIKYFHLHKDFDNYTQNGTTRDFVAVWNSTYENAIATILFIDKMSINYTGTYICGSHSGGNETTAAAFRVFLELDIAVVYRPENGTIDIRCGIYNTTIKNVMFYRNGTEMENRATLVGGSEGETWTWSGADERLASYRCIGNVTRCSQNMARSRTLTVDSDRVETSARYSPETQTMFLYCLISYGKTVSADWFVHGNMTSNSTVIRSINYENGPYLSSYNQVYEPDARTISRLSFSSSVVEGDVYQCTFDIEDEILSKFIHPNTLRSAYDAAMLEYANSHYLEWVISGLTIACVILLTFTVFYVLRPVRGRLYSNVHIKTLLANVVHSTISNVRASTVRIWTVFDYGVRYRVGTEDSNPFISVSISSSDTG